MNINRNDLCPCGSGKKYKNCCYNNIPKEEKVTVEEIVEPTNASKDMPIEDSHDEKTYEIENAYSNEPDLERFILEHVKKIKKIREENENNPNYPSGSISWKEIEKIREENKENPNYPHVYWVTDDSLYVKIGEIEKEGITVEEAIELFKNNKLFMDELKFLLEDYADTKIGSLENENSYKAHL